MRADYSASIKDAAVQANTAGSAVFGRSCNCIQSFQSGSSYDLSTELSPASNGRLCVLEKCSGPVGEGNANISEATKVNLSVPGLVFREEVRQASF